MLDCTLASTMPLLPCASRVTGSPACPITSGSADCAGVLVARAASVAPTVRTTHAAPKLRLESNLGSILPTPRSRSPRFTGWLDPDGSANGTVIPHPSALQLCSRRKPPLRDASDHC